MHIKNRIAAAGVAGVLGVTGLAVAVAPMASAATVAQDDATTGVAGRLEALRDALAGLVTDGTLTQEQADEVATTLDESDALRGGGGRGHGWGAVDLTAAAEALGLTEDELTTALGVDGTTLSDVAADQGVDTSVLVDALVAAGTERIDAAVADGRLTQEEADERIAALPERIESEIQQELRRGPGRGPRGTTAPDDATGSTDAAEGTADTA